MAFAPTFSRTPKNTNLYKIHQLLILNTLLRQMILLPIYIQCAEMRSEEVTLHKEASQSAQLVASKTDNVNFLSQRGVFERSKDLFCSLWIKVTWRL